MKSVSWILVLFLLAAGCAEPSVVENKEDAVDADKATEVDSENTGVAENEASPQETLSDLRNRNASLDEYIAFMEAHSGSEMSLNALSALSKNQDLDEADKQKLSEFVSTQFIANEEVADDLAFDAAGILVKLADSDSKDEVLRQVFRRFVDGQDSLGTNALKLISMAFAMGSSEFKGEVSEKLVAGFADDDQMARLVSMMSRGAPGAHVPKFLTSLAEKSENENVQGNALMSLATFYDMAGSVKSRLEDPKFVARVPEDIADYLREFDEEAHADEVAAIYERIASDFADVQGERGRTLGDVADDKLFVLNNLSIGKTAPDIVGEDLDGEEFKLSDYRGKVVLLDFWGDW